MFAGACIENECFECADDDDCFDGGKCLDGACIQCEVDADCVAPGLCRNNMCCNEGILPGSDCNPLNNAPASAEFPGSNKDCPFDVSEFCDAYGTCLPNGTCDNDTNRCKEIGQFCVVEDAKCAWCLEDADCEGWECDDFAETTGPFCNGNADCRECGEDADCAAYESFCEGTFSCSATGCVADVPSYTPCGTATEPVCDYINDRCVAECVVDQDCVDLHGAVENFCNGTRVCNEDGTCGYSGTTCPSGQCLPIAEKCYDCEDNMDCGADRGFPGQDVCVIGQDGIEAGDNDTNYCAECLVDSDCDQGVCDVVVDFPKQNTCIDCLEDDDCEGTDTCLKGECVQCTEDCPCPDGSYCLTEYPYHCGFRFGRPEINNLNICVQCRNDGDCPTGQVCNEAECPEGDDIYDDCGEYIGTERSEGVMINECVGCVTDEDCNETATDPCKVDGVCDEDTNTCSYSSPCGQLECFPAGYYNTEDFGKTTFVDCEDGYCPSKDYYCSACASNEACMDELFCNGVESCDKNGGCQEGVNPCAEGQLCDEAADDCLDVDCLEDTDCLFFEECDEANECAAAAATCGLKLPKSIKGDKLAEGTKIKIKGIKGQDFDAAADAYFGPDILEVGAAQMNKKQTKRTSVIKGIPGAVFVAGDILTVRVGDCEGTMEIK